MGGPRTGRIRNARARRREEASDPVVMLIGWAPVKGEQRLPFDPDTYAGVRMRSLAGGALERFAVTANLHERPVPEDEYDLEITPALRRRAGDLLTTYPSLPVVAVGRMVARTLGIDGQIRKVGFLRWTTNGTRRVAVMPHPSGRNRWWNRRENREAAQIFLRSIAGTIGPLALPVGGPRLEPIDLDDLEHVVRVFGAPPQEAVAAYLKMSPREFAKALTDPEVREAWEHGRSTSKLALYRARFEKAIRGGPDGLGDASMQRYLSQVLLGERLDETGKFAAPDRPNEADREVRITWGQLQHVLRKLNAKYGIEEDFEELEIPSPAEASPQE